MGALYDYFAAIGRAATTIAEGMAVTGAMFVKRPATIQYPDRTARPLTAMLPERARGLLEVDLEACTGCGLCAKTCPIDCIALVVTKGGERLIERYDIDLAKCMYCGLCVEACPTGGLRHTREFEAGMYRPGLLSLRFVTQPVPAAKPVKKGETASAPKPLGSILRALLPGPTGRDGEGGAS